MKEAFDNVKKAVEAHDVECIDTLIGDIVPPAELMKTQTDRKIAQELERTYEVQREAQVQRQALERETAVANMQNEVVRSEQTVRISQQTALSAAEVARGEANATRLRAEGQAASVRLNGEAEATARVEAEATANWLVVRPKDHHGDWHRQGRIAPPGCGGDRRRATTM